MKTERRHELQTNQLADSLSHWIDAVQPYTRAIVGLVVLVIVLMFTVAFVRRHSASQAESGWDQYFQALSEGQDAQDKLEEVAEQYPGTPVAFWSKLMIGDLELAQGSRLLFTDRDVAREHLRTAAGNFSDVRGAARQPALEQRALYGLARAEESLGEIEKARDDYRELVKRWPNSPFASAAQERADDLARTDTKEFYDWFAKQQPSKQNEKLPGIPGMRSDFNLDNFRLDDPKSGPDLEQPSSETPDSNGPADGTPEQPAGEGSETPGNETPNGGAPGTGDNADQNGAAPAAPAAEPPASDAAPSGGTK